MHSPHLLVRRGSMVGQWNGIVQNVMCQQPQHISYRGVEGHGLRVQRHDRVNAYVGRRLSVCGWSVLYEPHIPFGTTFKKPDIVARHEDHCLVINTTIVADNSELDDQSGQKAKYYNCPEIVAWLHKFFPGLQIGFTGVALNWRGVMSVVSTVILKNGCLRNEDIHVMSVKTLAGDCAPMTHGWLGHS